MIQLDMVGKTLGPYEYNYTWKDVILYHLGIGAKANQLKYVYENAKEGLVVCPSFAVIPAFKPFVDALKLLKVDLKTVLHGEEWVNLYGSLPTSGKLLTNVTISGIYDKRKAALIVLKTETSNESGIKLFDTEAVLYCRGLGGWGGDPGPKRKVYRPPENMEPDFSVEEQTADNQAALYRLSGDVNPLHIDPEAAKAAGFERPILHGLCTFGFAARVLLDELCKGDPAKFVSFGGRFSDVVFPGDRLNILGWKIDKDTFHVEVRTPRGPVFTNSRIQIKTS